MAHESLSTPLRPGTWYMLYVKVKSSAPREPPFSRESISKPACCCLRGGCWSCYFRCGAPWSAFCCSCAVHSGAHCPARTRTGCGSCCTSARCCRTLRRRPRAPTWTTRYRFRPTKNVRRCRFCSLAIRHLEHGSDSDSPTPTPPPMIARVCISIMRRSYP